MKTSITCLRKDYIGDIRNEINKYIGRMVHQEIRKIYYARIWPNIGSKTDILHQSTACPGE